MYKRSKLHASVRVAGQVVYKNKRLLTKYESMYYKILIWLLAK